MGAGSGHVVTLDPVSQTLAWYNTHAAKFAAETDGADLTPLYGEFLHYVGLKGRILDAGCGAGRDAAAFSALGYEVVAFDGAKEMVQLARDRTGHRVPVHQMNFGDVAWTAEFDGIWACASLLHVPSSYFADAIQKLAEALRPNGTVYMSFKLGEGEGFSDDRFFVNHTPESLAHSLRSTPLALVCSWVSNDVRPTRRGERWLNAIARMSKSASSRIAEYAP